MILPDRPTLFNFSLPKGSPFGWLKGSAPDFLHPSPLRPVHERLGLSKGEFEARLRLEIDEVLLQSEEDRRLSRIQTEFAPDSPESSSPLAEQSLPLLTVRL